MRVFSLASQLASGYCTKIGNGIKNYCKLHAEEQDEHARLTGWRYECGSLWGLINTLEYDGVLDAAKATSVLSRVQHESAAQFLAGVGREAAPPSSRLPMVAVLTRPSLAGCSGRCLLWSNAQLLPMQIQGDSSHWGVGPGVPATVEIVDADFALGARSTRTRLSEAQHNLVTAAAALALIADMWLSTSHTIKSAMLQESTVSAVTSIRSVLDTPEGCAIDALVATRVAGMAATDTDATA